MKQNMNEGTKGAEKNQRKNIRILQIVLDSKFSGLHKSYAKTRSIIKISSGIQAIGFGKNPSSNIRKNSTRKIKMLFQTIRFSSSFNAVF